MSCGKLRAETKAPWKQAIDTLKGRCYLQTEAVGFGKVCVLHDHQPACQPLVTPMCSPQTCSRPDKRSEGFKTTTTEKEALRLEMRQRDVRHMRVVTLSAQTCGNRVLQRHASRLSMECGEKMCNGNNSTTKLVQNSNKSFRAHCLKANRGVFNYLRHLHIQRDYTEWKTGRIVGTKCELCILRSVCVLQMKYIFVPFCLHLTLLLASCHAQTVWLERSVQILGSSFNETESLLLMTDILTVRGLGLGMRRHVGPRGILEPATVSTLQKHY